MAGQSRFTAQERAKRALFEAAKVALADDVQQKKVSVLYGFKWPIATNDWVAFTDTESDIDTVDISPRRTLQERITLRVNVGVFRAGHTEAVEIAVAERAWDLLARIQDHVRTTDITLGGVVMWCLPGSSQSAGATDVKDATRGRYLEIAADFVCEHRITTA